MKSEADIADDAVRYLANFHAITAVTCLVGALALTLPAVGGLLQSNSTPWLRAAQAPAMLVLSAAFVVLAYGGYRRSPWGWGMAVAAYAGALVVAVWAGSHGMWASWSAVPAAAFIVFMLLTKGVRGCYGLAEPHP